MTDANKELTVHVCMEFPEDHVSPEEVQLVVNQLAELIGQVVRMDNTGEV